MAQDSKSPRIVGNLSGAITTSFSNVTQTYPTSMGYREVVFGELSSTDLLTSLMSSLIPALTEARETAKYQYEEEGDEEAFGEYQGLVAALEIVQKTLRDAPSKRYSVPNPDDYTFRYSLPPNHPLYGHTGR